jgi:hypothetical protein
LPHFVNHSQTSINYREFHSNTAFIARQKVNKESNQKNKAWMSMRRYAHECGSIYVLAEHLEKFLNFMQA